MGKQHRRRVRRNTGFPTHRRVKRRWVDVQQNQVTAAAEQPIRRQVHLLRRRKVDELGAWFGMNAATASGARPILGPAHVHQSGGGGRHTSQLARPSGPECVRNDTPDTSRGTRRKRGTSETVNLRRYGEAMNATLTGPELTRADRCDRCGAAARVRAKLPSGAELLFCQHHANKHESKLIELSAVLEVSGN